MKIFHTYFGKPIYVKVPTTECVSKESVGCCINNCNATMHANRREGSCWLNNIWRSLLIGAMRSRGSNFDSSISILMNGNSSDLVVMVTSNPNTVLSGIGARRLDSVGSTDFGAFDPGGKLSVESLLGCVKQGNAIKSVTSGSKRRRRRNP